MKGYVGETSLRLLKRIVLIFYIANTPYTIPIWNKREVIGMVKIGAVLQAVRVRAGYNQEELAHKLHLSQSDISKIEKDRKMPALDTLAKWVETTNAKEVLVAYLCGIDGIAIMQNILQIFGG